MFGGRENAGTPPSFRPKPESNQINHLLRPPFELHDRFSATHRRNNPVTEVFTFPMNALFRCIKPSLRCTMATTSLFRGRGVLMRFSVAMAVACLTMAGLTVAAQAQASIRQPTNIEAQGLAPALRQFAKEREIQLVYRSELVEKRQTGGAAGELTVEEALTQLLSGTGLTFQYLDDKGITIIPSAVSARTPAERFRLAQAEAGATATTSSDSSQAAPLEELEEIVVTAQKRKEFLQDVPISISVLSGAELDSSTAEGMTELLNRVPGVATVLGAQGGSTQVTVRGVSAGDAIFAGSSPVAYYLDSVPFGFVKSAIAPDLNPYDLSQVEVLRGPQGTLYGASALNGVVRVLTKDADLDAFELKARTSLSDTDGGAENYRGDLAVNVPIIEGKWAARAVVGYENLSGWIDRRPAAVLNVPDEDNVNDAQMRNYRLKLNGQPTEKLAIGLSAWRSSADYGGKSTSLDDDTTSGTHDELIGIDFETYGLKLDYKFSAFTLSSRTSYVDYSNDSLLDIGPLSGDTFPEVFLTAFQSRILSEEVLLNSEGSGPWEWSAGAFYRRGQDRLFQTYPDAPGNFYVDYTDRSESAAVFGELSRRFYGDRLKWTLGLRHFKDNVLNKENSLDPDGSNGPPRALQREGDSFHSTTPRAVLTWYPRDTLTAYASYSEGFRSGFPQNANVALAGAIGFPPLRPDKLRNYEVGAKGSILEGRLHYDTAVYYIDWKDVQQSLGVPFETPAGATVLVSALVNGTSADGMGVDFGLATEPLAGLTLGLNFSWNDLAFTGQTFSNGALLFDKGDRPSLSPEYTAGGSLEYAFPIGGGGFKGKFAASANYTSKQAAAGVYGDSMLISRASFSIDSANRWTATLFVDNANNEDGTPVITVESLPELNLRVRPRTVGMQFEYRFASQ